MPGLTVLCSIAVSVILAGVSSASASAQTNTQVPGTVVLSGVACYTASACVAVGYANQPFAPQGVVVAHLRRW
jgi:hypothetical protein